MHCTASTSIVLDGITFAVYGGTSQVIIMTVIWLRVCILMLFCGFAMALFGDSKMLLEMSA